ncbi:MAG: hypothetical protein HYT87_06205 [Nitrospirae bacterium]|nr:hypothetical protein [Nitrospirota bacterium]
MGLIQRACLHRLEPILLRLDPKRTAFLDECCRRCLYTAEDVSDGILLTPLLTIHVIKLPLQVPWCQ